MNRYSLDLTLELLSPCFLGGAFQQPEFRIASLRGVWRYWYRALYGRGDETVPGEDERKLFGGIAPRGGSAGHAAGARVVLRGAADDLRRSPWANPRPAPGDVNGRGYLFFSMGMNKRSYLDPGQTLPLRLLISADAALASRARTSLAAACSFSGLGARSRRLAGAVSLRAEASAPPFRSAPAGDPEDLARYLSDLISAARREGSVRRGTALPGYHIAAPGVFRAGVLKKTFGAWVEAADTVGRQYAQFRQFDPPDSGRRRQPDYSVAKNAIAGSAPPTGQTVRRAAFGLPIGFRFNSLGGKSVQATPTQSDRRGSPLFLTLQRLADDRLAVVWCVFRSRVTVDDKVKLGRVVVPAPPDLSLIDEMLQRPEWAYHPVME